MKIKKVREHHGKAKVHHGDGSVEYIDITVGTYSLSADKEEVSISKFPWLRAMLESEGEQTLVVHFRVGSESVVILYSTVGEDAEDFPCDQVLWDLREFCLAAISKQEAA